MSALSRVRACLTSKRTWLYTTRRGFKSRDYRTKIDVIIQGLEALIDYADDAFDDDRAFAARAHWREQAEIENAMIEQWIETFEAAAKAGGMTDEDLKRDETGVYIDACVLSAWKGWFWAMQSRALPRKQEAS